MVVKYGDDRVLQSGWISGEDRLHDRAAAVDVSLDTDRVILSGFRVQNRARPHDTFKLFFNPLYYGLATKVEYHFGQQTRRNGAPFSRRYFEVRGAIDNVGFDLPDLDLGGTTEIRAETSARGRREKPIDHRSKRFDRFL